MPSKKAKNSGNRAHISHAEKAACKVGSISQRLGSDSQLPFGYCPLSLSAIDDAVVTPSGHLYSREAILEYILQKMQEIKMLQAKVDAEAKDAVSRENANVKQEQLLMIQNFEDNQTSIRGVLHGSTGAAVVESEDAHARKRRIDETDKAERVASLKAVSPWLPQFTPSAPAALTKAPPRRPASPFSGMPLRAKDLIPVNLVREENANSSGPVRFMCPVSRKTITTQRVVLIKSTGTLILESAAKETSFPTMRDPVTNRPFSMDEVLELVPAASGFAASGIVEAKKYRPSFN